MFKHASLVLFVIVLMIGCKPGVPRNIIQPSMMEDILYDYHLAQAMSNYQEGRYDSLLVRVYEAAVYKKYGITKAEFDSSMVYYTRHTDRLHKIYESLSKRFEADMMALGGAGAGAGSYSSFGTTGDTANVWSGPQTIVLLHHPAFNHYSFTIKADTSFHAGDKIILNFNSEFIYQEGMRDGVVVLAVKFSNDSVATRTMHATGSSHYGLELSDEGRIGIKEVKGYFLLNSAAGESENRTTMKLVVFRDIALVRMRNDKPAPEDIPVDSLPRKDAKDTAVIEEEFETIDGKVRPRPREDALPFKEKIQRNKQERLQK